MAPLQECTLEHGLRRVDDDSVERFLSAEHAALIVVGSSSPWCVDYLAGVEIAQVLGDLPGLAVGVLVLDAPGSERFVAENDWLAEAAGLPYTVLYRNGQRVDGFVAFSVATLLNRLEYLAFLPCVSAPVRRVPTRVAA